MGYSLWGWLNESTTIANVHLLNVWKTKKLLCPTNVKYNSETWLTPLSVAQRMGKAPAPSYGSLQGLMTASLDLSVAAANDIRFSATVGLNRTMNPSRGRPSNHLGLTGKIQAERSKQMRLGDRTSAVWDRLRRWTFQAFSQESNCLSHWEKDILGVHQETQNDCIWAQCRDLIEGWEFV